MQQHHSSTGDRGGLLPLLDETVAGHEPRWNATATACTMSDTAGEGDR
ncbi:hypothetical protein ACFQL1_10520 [Halomicroarcula sp. GCM10025709]|nr:hypothetical protein [Halomicroarcula sp. YJ-61-S]